LLKNATAGYNLPSFIKSIIDCFVINRISRSNIKEASVRLSIFEIEFENIKTIIHFKVFPHMLHIECIELSLGLSEG